MQRTGRIRDITILPREASAACPPWRNQFIWALTSWARLLSNHPRLGWRIMSTIPCVGVRKETIENQETICRAAAILFRFYFILFFLFRPARGSRAHTGGAYPDTAEAGSSSSVSPAASCVPNASK